MKIVFISAPLPKDKYLNRNYCFCTPIGISNLASVMENNGHDVRIIDSPTLGLDIKKVTSTVKKYDPDIVGISSTSNLIGEAVELAKKLKGELENTSTILGGVHATMDYKSISEYKCFDYIFAGEGEITMPKIIKSLGVRNNNHKKIIFGKEVKNLDDIPTPAYHLLPMKKYFLPSGGSRSTVMETSRGCIFSCKFCCNPVKKLKFKSVKNVIENMRILKDDYKISWIKFTDANFIINKKRVREICKHIIGEKIDISWGCEGRCDLIDKEILKLMKKSGCTYIAMGIESGSEIIRENAGKKISLNTIKRAFKSCSDVGIETCSYFMAGLPGETKDDIMESIKLAFELDAQYCLFTPLVLWPGTEYFKALVNEGKIDKKFWNSFVSKKELPFYIPEGFDRKTFLNFIMKWTKKYYLRKDYIVNRMKRIKNMNDVKRDIKNFNYLFRVF